MSLLTLFGWIIETVDDAQKFRFKQQPEKRGYWIIKRTQNAPLG